MEYPKIGIRPVIDGRWGGVREGLEQQTINMARAAAKLIGENVFYQDVRRHSASSVKRRLAAAQRRRAWPRSLRRKTSARRCP